MPWNHKIHSDIVQGDDDLEGIIAYHLYKKDKIDWIEKSKKDNGGSPPNKADIDLYWHLKVTPDKISRYRQLAKQIVIEYNDTIIAESASIQQQVMVDVVSDQTYIAVDQAVQKYIGKKSSIGAFSLNVLASIVATIIIVFLVTMLWLTIGRASGKTADEVLCDSKIPAEIRATISGDCPPDSNNG